MRHEGGCAPAEGSGSGAAGSSPVASRCASQGTRTPRGGGLRAPAYTGCTQAPWGHRRITTGSDGNLLISLEARARHPPGSQSREAPAGTRPTSGTRQAHRWGAEPPGPPAARRAAGTAPGQGQTGRPPAQGQPAVPLARGHASARLLRDPVPAVERAWSWYFCPSHPLLQTL